MEESSSFKVIVDDLSIEYTISPQKNLSTVGTFSSEIVALDAQINSLNSEINQGDTEIHRLTNEADKLDYIISVTSGILCGLIDSFFVGEFSLENANKWGSDKVNEFVKKVAEKQSGKKKDLLDSVEFLEEKWKIPSDNLAGEFGGSLRHHLNDFAHHPTPVGLIFSLLTQFTGNAYGVDSSGVFKIIPVRSTELIGKDFPTKISLGVITWFFHLVSDIAGSSNTIRNNILLGRTSVGTGLPGPFVSFLYEVSKLPLFNKGNQGNSEFTKWIAKLWNGTLLAKHDENGKIIRDSVIKFDLRTELGTLHEFGKQAVPVLINECIVRGFYFIKRIVSSVKEKPINSFDDFIERDWKIILPFKNRTIIRMLTISTGTFTAVDMTDAAIRAGIKSGGNGAVFFQQFILHVNFVGIGRFAIAVGSDIKMGIERNKYRDERIKLMNQQLHLMNAKLAYMQGDTWLQINELDILITKCEENLVETLKMYIQSNFEINQDLKNLGDNIERIRKNDPDFLEKMKKALR